MNWWRRRAERERDMQEELDSLAALAREHGEPAALGNLTRTAEEAREAWGWMWLDRLGQDLRYAARSLRTQPAFAGIAVLTLALAVGLNTTIFTAVNTVFLRPLPVHNHSALRLLSWKSAKRSFGGRFLTQPMWDANILNRGEGLKYFSYAAYLNLKEHAGSFSDLACTRPGPSVNLPDGRTKGIQAVSGNFFRTLGVDAVVGRTITPDDDRPGGPAVAVISYGLWQETFGGDLSVLNHTLKLNQTQVTIVGVLPQDFFGLDPGFRYSVVAPIQAVVAPNILSDAHNWNGCQAVFGIVRPGISEEQGRAESEALVRQTILADPPREPWDAPQMSLTKLDRGFDTLRKAASQPFGLVMSTAGLILLIACANIGGLLLARGTARGKEIATRLALGASRGRVARQLLTESFVLAAAGSVAGVALAYAASPLLPRLFQQFNYYQFNNLGVQFRPDLRVLGFSAMLALATGLLFGLAPALRTTRVALMAMIKMNTGSQGRFRFASGKAMLALQVALSMVLLIGAALFLRTLWNLRSVPMGYDPGGILFFTVDTGPNRQEFVTRVMARLEELPEVTSTTASIWPVFTSAPDTYLPVCIPGDSPKNFDDRFADSDLILPRFFETWRVPLLLGRDFQSSETPGNIIVNQAFLKRYLAGVSDPLGRTVELGPRCSAATIIGVVANSTDRPRITPRPFVYRPYAYQPTQLTFTIRTANDPAALAPVLGRIVAGLGTRIFEPVTTGSEYRDRTMTQERLFTTLLGAFSGLALFIACIGIYGITTYMVRRRTPEIGIRMSLGARRLDVFRLVMRETLAPAAAGIAIGTVSAVGVSSLVASVLFGVSRSDPWAIAGAALLLLLMAAVAAGIPARLASRIDPMLALRHE
jgi:predicted permease